MQYVSQYSQGNIELLQVSVCFTLRPFTLYINSEWSKEHIPEVHIFSSGYFHHKLPHIVFRFTAVSHVLEDPKCLQLDRHFVIKLTCLQRVKTSNQPCVLEEVFYSKLLRIRLREQNPELLQARQRNEEVCPIGIDNSGNLNDVIDIWPESGPVAHNFIQVSTAYALVNLIEVDFLTPVAFILNESL